MADGPLGKCAHSFQSLWFFVESWKLIRIQLLLFLVAIRHAFHNGIWLLPTFYANLKRSEGSISRFDSHRSSNSLRPMSWEYSLAHLS